MSVMSAERVPLLTIHVSVFNLDKYIEQCLDSILTQDFNDYELILVDNGSTDRSIEICERYAEKYSEKIKYKKFPLPTYIGRPYTYARAEMQGEYFMTVDGDDYITPGSLKRIAGIIQDRYPDAIMGTFLSDVETGSSSFQDASFDPQRINGVSYRDALKYLATVPNFHTVQWRFIVKNDILKICEDFTKFFNENLKAYSKLINKSLYGDLINVLNILSGAKSIEFMKEPFYVYRCRSGSLSATRVGDKTGAGFLVGLISMKAWFTYNKNENVQALIRSQLHKFYSLYASVCTTITEEGYMKMADLIDTYKEDFLSLREYNIAPLSEFCDLVNRYGALQGLMMFTKLQEANLLYKLQPYTSEDIYVFPTGICGESTLLLLKRWNLQVKGFFDNDSSKEALLFQSYPCMLPERLRAFSEDQKEKALVVITTSYEHLIPVFRKQLVGLGIPDSRIIA
ncbi:MAG: glycosyl transferase family 2 [Clostridia bacterium]|nr:glycosyl transferase family 2 [Clostridia bacterium]